MASPRTFKKFTDETPHSNVTIPSNTNNNDNMDIQKSTNAIDALKKKLAFLQQKLSSEVIPEWESRKTQIIEKFGLDNPGIQLDMSSTFQALLSFLKKLALTADYNLEDIAQQAESHKNKIHSDLKSNLQELKKISASVTNENSQKLAELLLSITQEAIAILNEHVNMLNQMQQEFNIAEGTVTELVKATEVALSIALKFLTFSISVPNVELSFVQTAYDRFLENETHGETAELQDEMQNEEAWLNYAAHTVDDKIDSLLNLKKQQPKQDNVNHSKEEEPDPAPHTPLVTKTSASVATLGAFGRSSKDKGNPGQPPENVSGQLEPKKTFCRLS